MEPAQMSGAIVDQSVTIDSQLPTPSSDDADAKGCSLYDELEPDGKRQKSSEDNELEPDIKRQKSSESLPPTKLCIICSSFYADDDTSYDIFVADLNSPCYAAFKNKDDSISIAPTFRFELDDDSKGFCLLGSTLYIFESTDLKDGPERKSVYTIDLSKCDLTNPSLKKLEKSELDSAPDMNYPKIFPFATPTPDGKILVFSAVICLEPFDKIAGENDFELYDPVAKTWQNLPGIMHYDWLAFYRECSNNIWISAFTFIDKSTFFLQTKTGLMFSLDLRFIDDGWEQKHTFFGASTVPFSNGRFFVIHDLLCATPWGAYDIQKERESPEWFSLPLSSDDDVYPSAITLVDDVKNGKFNFCSIESGISTETEYPHFVINPFSCDLTKYKEDKKKMGDSAELSASISVGESFNFRVDGQQCDSFITLNMFSF